MKKAILLISMAIMLFLGGLSMAFAQDLPSAKKDSINADKAAKPQFYDAAPEEAPKSDAGTNYFLIAGVVLVVGAGGYFLMKKKKN